MGLLCYSNILPSEGVILVDGVELGDGLAGFFQLSGDTEWGSWVNSPKGLSKRPQSVSVVSSTGRKGSLLLYLERDMVGGIEAGIIIPYLKASYAGISNQIGWDQCQIISSSG